MNSTTIGVLAFVGGVAAGLLIAKLYARSKVEDAIGSGLTSLGLSQSTANGIAQGIAPVVTG
jgi:Na+-transporting methylmalonyl-CoA/oxaloacetate decarboxylase beta subunit